MKVDIKIESTAEPLDKGDRSWEGHAGGLEILAYRAGHTMTGIRLLAPVPIEL